MEAEGRRGLSRPLNHREEMRMMEQYGPDINLSNQRVFVLPRSKIQKQERDEIFDARREPPDYWYFLPLQMMRNLQKLACFSATPWILLETMEYLRRHDSLPLSWLAMEKRIVDQFVASEVNRTGWAWLLHEDDGLELMKIYRENTSKAYDFQESGSAYQKSLISQLKEAESFLSKLLELENPLENEVMMKELENQFFVTKGNLLKKIEGITF